jgi:hypothetical protein
MKQVTISQEVIMNKIITLPVMVAVIIAATILLITITIITTTQPVKIWAVSAKSQQFTNINFIKFIQQKIIALHCNLYSSSALVKRVIYQGSTRSMIEESAFIRFPTHNIIPLPSIMLVNNYQLWEALDIISIAFLLAFVVDQLT